MTALFSHIGVAAFTFKEGKFMLFRIGGLLQAKGQGAVLYFQYRRRCWPSEEGSFKFLE
jgi:hypothetical protein